MAALNQKKFIYLPYFENCATMHYRKCSASRASSA